MRILMTGADGFVGQHLGYGLATSGHDLILVSGPAASSPLQVDLTNDAETVRLVNASRPEAIIHLAAQSSVGRSWQDPAGTLAVNTIGTVHLWKAAVACGVRRFVYSSTAEVYGAGSSMPLTEETPLAPRNPYGVSKAAAEQLIQQLHHQSCTELLILRPFNHIGPGQAPGFVVSDFVRQIGAVKANKADTIRVGDLTPVRDFLDIRDIVEAYRVAVEKSDLQGVYNLCSGCGRSIQSVLADLMALAGVSCSIEQDSHLIRPVDTPLLVGDPARFRGVTEWTARYPWNETLRGVLARSPAP